MNASPDALRPAPGGARAAVMAGAMQALPAVFGILRAVWPIPRFGNTVALTRHDDVREVFQNDDAFRVPYKPKLDVIMGGQPFFLGMDDTADYRRDTAAMRQVIRPDDIPARLAPATEALAEQVVAGAGGRLDVVELVRQVTFTVLGEYLGIPDPADASMRVWATRLFEFQFADRGGDPALRREVDVIAPALAGHIQGLIEQRRGGNATDDVLGRCLRKQAEGAPGFTDGQIRTALTGFIVGGPPQPPMVVPQAMEQLLRRPDALAGAQQAARNGDDRLLAGYVFEAMRFDPLAPALPRVATRDVTVAAGTSRARLVRKGSSVLVAFSSAMMDGRRVSEPRRFDPSRFPHDYIHFGNGLHTCFGIHINKAILPLMLKPLLRRPGLRRAPGAPGRLSKRGAFADRLVVEYAA